MIRPGKWIRAFSGSLRRRTIGSLYRYERTARRIGADEKDVYEAYMNRFVTSMSSSAFCRLLINGELDKDMLKEWGGSGFYGQRVFADVVSIDR